MEPDASTSEPKIPTQDKPAAGFLRRLNCCLIINELLAKLLIIVLIVSVDNSK